MTIPDLLKQVSEFIMLRVDEIQDYHQEEAAADVTVNSLDDLVADVLELKSFVDALKDIQTSINKSIMRLESRSGNYLQVLEREDYVSPHGNIIRAKDWHVNMPKDPEEKGKLFDWMKEREIFETYATVNSASLNSLFMAEWEAAKKKDPLMEVLFSMPGVPDPQLNEYTTIKAPRGQRSKRKEVINDD